ncbi:MAG TPA: GntR family transcriptional regulator, partial [Planctomycetaceae bacterium]|nr:GntR family transcriptional regulator [Planctomycetaceae bacterium]
MASVVTRQITHGSRRQKLVQQVLSKFFQGEYQPNQRM